MRKAARENPQAADFLPAEVSYKELKKGITNARTLRNTVNRLTRAKKPNAFKLVRQADGSIITQYERNEFRIMRSVRERRKSMTARAKGIEQPTGRIGSLAAAKLAPDKRPTSTLSAGAIRRFLETQERVMAMSTRDKALQYYNNYVRALETVFSGFEDFDDDILEIKLIIKSMMQSQPERLIELLDSGDERYEIKFVYDPQQRQAKLELLKEAWNDALGKAA